MIPAAVATATNLPARAISFASFQAHSPPLLAFLTPERLHISLLI